MRLGIAQINTVGGELAHTMERVAACSRMAAQRDAELLLFPITTLSGPSGVPLAVEGPFLADCERALTDAAPDLACPCVVPLPVTVDDMPTVELLLVEEGKVRPLRYVDEGLAAATGDRRDDVWVMPTVSIGKTKVAFVFTFDELDALGGPDDPGGYDVVVFVSGYGYAVNDPSSALGATLTMGRFVSDVRASGAWLVGVGGIGGYGGQVFTGSSFALSPDGRLAGCAPAFEEDVLVVSVGRDVTLLGSEAMSFEPYDEHYHLWQALALGLADFVRKSGREDVAFLFDGSLTAQALACLCCDALGPTHVHLVVDGPSERDAGAKAAALGQALRVEVSELPSKGAGRVQESTSDVRAVAELLCWEAERQAVLLSTSDKTALSVEGSALLERILELAPFGDVYRSDVLAMFHVRNAIAPVAGHIGLAPCDVPDLGVPADPADLEVVLGDVDAVLERHLEGEEPFALIRSGCAPELVTVVDAVRDAYARCEQARRMCPAFLMVSTCTVAEARLPFGFAWHDEGRSVEPRWRSQAEPAAKADPPAEKTQVDGRIKLPQSVGEDALREALDLLRDMSVSSGADWKNPFSEN